MENNYRAEIRFRFYHYFFYIGGVPLFYSTLSISYRVYSFLCHVCFYMMIISMFMDIYHHSEDWDHLLDSSMLFTLFAGECCALTYFRWRYIRSDTACIYPYFKLSSNSKIYNKFVAYYNEHIYEIL
jgi:hypothetical protein